MRARPATNRPDYLHQSAREGEKTLLARAMALLGGVQRLRPLAGDKQALLKGLIEARDDAGGGIQRVEQAIVTVAWRKCVTGLASELAGEMPPVAFQSSTVASFANELDPLFIRGAIKGRHRRRRSQPGHHNHLSWTPIGPS